MKEIGLRLKEAAFSILPIVVVILLLNFIIPGFSVESSQGKFGPVMTSLLISAVPMIIGTALFSIGAEKSVAKIGEVVGTTLTKRKSLTLLLVIGALMGFLATLAEPDLSVLASRINPTKDWFLIVIASVGVGLFMIVAILRVVYNKSLKYWLTIGYGLVFTLGLFADQDFFTVLFDSGGVTTGVITVPFILAMGMGVARVLGGDNAEDDSFGYSGLCSLGTVLAVMIFSVIMKQLGKIEEIQNLMVSKFSDIGDASLMDSMMRPLTSYGEIAPLYLSNFLHSLRDVALSLMPIIVFFVIFNFYAKIKGKGLASIAVGFLYTFIGMVLFFLGAESGFIPLATQMGAWFALQGESQMGLFILVVVLIGFIAMLAEPSVRVLALNVSEVSRGVISQPLIYVALGSATSLALLLNVIRSTFDISYIYFIVPLFGFALLLAFFSPDIYVGIAIDAAGVATGTMASCVFLPMFIGFAANTYYTQPESFGRLIMRNGFGVVGLVSVMPIIALEIVGIMAQVKTRLAYQKALEHVMEPDDAQVIHLPSQTESVGA